MGLIFFGFFVVVIVCCCIPTCYLARWRTTRSATRGAVIITSSQPGYAYPGATGQTTVVTGYTPSYGVQQMPAYGTAYGTVPTNVQYSYQPNQPMAQGTPYPAQGTPYPAQAQSVPPYPGQPVDGPPPYGFATEGKR